MEKNVNSEYLKQSGQKTLHREFAISAMFFDSRSAKRAIRYLKRQGIDSEDISFFAPQNHGRRDFVYHLRTNVSVGVFVGAAIGAVLVGFIGMLIGANPTIELGPSAWMFRSGLAALGGLVVGAAAGALVGIGIPKPAARRYQFYLSEGGYVVMMHLKDRNDHQEAYFAFEKAGGQDITILEESHAWSAILPQPKNLTFH